VSKGIGYHRRWGQALRTCALRVGILAIPVLLICAFFAGCSDPVKRYRVLSYFFDGVPVPPELASLEPVTGEGEGEPNAPGGPASAGGALPAIAQIIYHPPYKNRQCNRCHSSEGSFQVAVDKDVCRNCHKSYYDVPADDWIHGPLVVGPCSTCHVKISHQSLFPALLDKPENDVCFGCHDPAGTLALPFHVEARNGEKVCGACHDPHSAGNRLLLADSQTFARRKFKAHIVSAPHNDWKQQDCKKCHAVGQSNVLLDPTQINKACLSCHEQKIIKDVPAEKLHKAVAEGKCLSCHTPHRSSRPHLIKPVAEKNCVPCHEVQKFNKPPHPPVVRADCLLCHSGHVYRQEHLLRPWEAEEPIAAPAGPAAIPSTAPAYPAATQPTSMPTPPPGDVSEPASAVDAGGQP